DCHGDGHSAGISPYKSRRKPWVARPHFLDSVREGAFTRALGMGSRGTSEGGRQGDLGSESLSGTPGSDPWGRGIAIALLFVASSPAVASAQISGQMRTVSCSPNIPNDDSTFVGCSTNAIVSDPTTFNSRFATNISGNATSGSSTNSTTFIYQVAFT